MSTESCGSPCSAARRTSHARSRFTEKQFVSRRFAMSTTAEVVRGAAARQPTNGVQAAPVTEMVLRPAVDFFEDAEGLTLHADMPGVSKERLNVHIDGARLLLEGTVQFAN